MKLVCRGCSDYAGWEGSRAIIVSVLLRAVQWWQLLRPMRKETVTTGAVKVDE